MRNVLWGLFILVAIGAMWVVFRTIGALLEVVLIGVIAGIVCGVIVIKFGQQAQTTKEAYDLQERCGRRATDVWIRNTTTSRYTTITSPGITIITAFASTNASSLKLTTALEIL